MGLILQGLLQEHLVCKDEGWVYLKEALLLGEKDHLILPFAGLVDLVPFIGRFPALKGGVLLIGRRFFMIERLRRL